MEELTENAEDDDEAKAPEVKLGRLKYKVSLSTFSCG
jgi:hypothetical protein